jgi:hypothetical protein
VKYFFYPFLLFLRDLNVSGSEEELKDVLLDFWEEFKFLKYL